jgi:hypothetical protein
MSSLELFRLIVLAAAFSGMASPRDARGFNVKDAEVVVSRPLGPKEPLWTNRKYAVLSDDGSKTEAVFTASGYGGKSGWVLGFAFSSDIDKPLEGDGSALPDGEKMLLACIDRFLSDVPAARVDIVGLDPRINGEYWGKFVRHMRAKILQMSDTLDSTNLRRIDNRAQAFILTSEDLETIANKISEKFGTKVRRVGLQGDGIAIKEQFFRQPMSVIASQPDLGFWIETASIDISFKPK